MELAGKSFTITSVMAGVSGPLYGPDRPWASVLQTENGTMLRHGLFAFSKPLLKASFHRVFSKQKPPSGGACLLLDQWSV